MKNDDDQKNDLLPDEFGRMDEMDRRYFLEYTLKLTALLASSSLIKPEEAKAQSGGIDAPSRFVNICITGGSCQLSSYLSPLANKSNANLGNMANNWKVPSLATSFRPTTAANAAIENVDYYTNPPDANANFSQKIFYARTRVGSYQMPVLWSSTIPVGTGSSTGSMRSLISSQCAMIYGLESAPAHSVAIDMLTNPEPGSFTVGGYVHYHSTKFPAFFPALGNKIGPTVFKSPNGASIKLVRTDHGNNTNEAKQAIESLIPNQAASGSTLVDQDENVNITRRNWLNQISGKMNVALQSIRDSNVALKPGISTLYDLLSQAKSKVETKEFESVLQKYTTALNKYKQLTRRAGTMARNSIQGITDPTTRQDNVNIVRNSLKKFGKDEILSVNGPNTAFGNVDVPVDDINIYNPLNPVSAEYSNGFGNSNFWISYHMAHIFAFAEVALDPAKPLTNVLNLGFGGSMVAVRCNSNSTVPDYHQIDNHNIGVVPNLLWNGLFYYTFNTLLNEFIQNMKGLNTSAPSSGSGQIAVTNDFQVKSLDDSSPTPTPASSATLQPWRDTVIALYTEFPRSPQPNGTGSDHGNQSCSIALFSGRIEGALKIYGKTKISTSDRPGAWGFHSIKMKAGSKYLSFTDAGVSIANLFVRNTPHPALTTLIGRSKILFSLDANGNIKFPDTIPESTTPFPYSLEDT